MKLSHESKVRLGVGIGAFVLIIGLVFGTSRLLAHSDTVRTTGILSGNLSDFDDMFDDDDLLDSGNYSGLNNFRAKRLMPTRSHRLTWT